MTPTERLLGFDRFLDMERGKCPYCDGAGCARCDYTGFRADQRLFTTGHGWRRLPFWPWHYVQHVRRARLNGWYSRLFCTWCVDDRMRGFYTAFDEHPENNCQRCADRNPVWHAPNPLWNEVMRGPDDLESRWGIVCPRCFAELAESKGIGTRASWRWEPATYPPKEDTNG